MTNEDKTVETTLEELELYLKNKKIRGVYAKYGLLELHFDHLVLTVAPRHISFIMDVKKSC